MFSGVLWRVKYVPLSTWSCHRGEEISLNMLFKDVLIGTSHFLLCPSPLLVTGRKTQQFNIHLQDMNANKNDGDTHEDKTARRWYPGLQTYFVSSGANNNVLCPHVSSCRAHLLTSILHEIFRSATYAQPMAPGTIVAPTRILHPYEMRRPFFLRTPEKWICQQRWTQGRTRRRGWNASSRQFAYSHFINTFPYRFLCLCVNIGTRPRTGGHWKAICGSELNQFKGGYYCDDNGDCDIERVNRILLLE